MWTTFCKRTNDPKLAYIETILDQRGITHRRNGESFHAPILEVLESDAGKACEILSSPARKELGLPVRYGVTLDDVPDNHPCFTGFECTDFELDQEAEWYAELNRGYAQDRI